MVSTVVALYRAIPCLHPELQTLHKSLLEKIEFTRVSKWIERSLGESIFEDGWMRVYSASQIYGNAS